MKDHHFKLSTSFTNLFAKKDQTSQQSITYYNFIGE
jgi:hypothetical protein